MQCPKCGAEIRRFDLAPDCKNCGVNIMLYTQEKDLADDAKRTELEFARARSIVGRIKLTYVGSPLVIARLVIGLLSVAVFAIPVMKLAVTLPLVETGFATGAVGVYQLVSNGMYMQLLNFFKAGISGALPPAMLAHCLFFVLSFLMELCMVVTYLLAAIDVRRGSKFLAIFSGIGCAFDIGMIAAMFAAHAAASAIPSVAVTVYPGAFVILAFQAAFLVINVLLYKQNPVFDIPEIDVRRIELLKKIRAGEVKYDDLSLPVFEDAAEEEKRKNLFGVIYEGAKEEGGD